MRIFTTIALSVLAAGTALAGGNAVKAPVGANVSVASRLAGLRAAVGPGDVEDIIWDAPEGEESAVVRDCDGFNVVAFDEATHSQILGSLMRMVTAPDGTVYFNHIASEYPDYNWVKAERDGDRLTIHCPQVLTQEYNYDTDESFLVYLVPMKAVVDDTQTGRFVATESMDYTFVISADGTMVAADPELLLGVCVYAEEIDGKPGDEEWRWVGFGDRDIKLSPLADKPVEVPADLKKEKWVFTDEYENTLVTVGFAADDVYVQGLNRSLPEAWVKGKLEGDKVTFPSGQYLGPDFEIYYNSFFCGGSFTYEEDPDNPEESIRYSSLEPASVFRYDSEARTLKSEVGYVINSTADRLFPLYSYEWVNLEYQNRNPDTPPAAPFDVVVSEGYDGATNIWFQVPNKDTDGNMLDVNSLYYEILMDGEPMTFEVEGEETTMLPYEYSDFYDIWVEGADHTVYVYTGNDKSYAVRSVYKETDGKLLYSAVAEGNASVEGVGIAGEAVAEAWYDLQGRRLVGRPAAGIAIRVATMADGRVVRGKVAVK